MNVGTRTLALAIAAAALATAAWFAGAAPPHIVRITAAPTSSNGPAAEGAWLGATFAELATAPATLGDVRPLQSASVRAVVASPAAPQSHVEAQLVDLMRARVDRSRFVDIQRFAPPASQLVGDVAAAVRAALGRAAAPAHLALLEAARPELLAALVALHESVDTYDRLLRHHAHDRLDTRTYVVEDLRGVDARGRRLTLTHGTLWRLRTVDGALSLWVDPAATESLVAAARTCRDHSAQIERLLEPLARPEHEAHEARVLEVGGLCTY